MGAVADVLSSLDGPVKYAPNGGNAGDSLINVGFYHAADRHLLDFTTVMRRDHATVSDDDTVVIGGGGALVPEWSATPAFIMNLAPRVQRIVVLSHSVRAVEPALRALRPQDLLICRERYSYEYVAGLGLRAEVALDDDMAFWVDPVKLRQEYLEYRPPRTLKNVGREATFAYHRLRSRRHRSVHAFRVDREADPSLDVRRSRRDDFSTVAWFASGGRPQNTYSARRLLQLIDLYDEIHTDRLHVVVGAALLGKRVVAYANNYYKVRGVIEQSLSDYPDLEFRDRVRP